MTLFTERSGTMPDVRKKITVTMYELTCNRCGKTWRSFHRNPAVCAKCHSAYWSRAKPKKPRAPREKK